LIDALRVLHRKIVLISAKEYYQIEVFELPLVQVTMWAGMTEANKKKVAEGITKVFEDLGVPKDAVHLIIYETPKTNWASGGKLHSETLKNQKSL
jgi:4-oxalocrotonate tautomerase